MNTILYATGESNKLAPLTQDIPSSLLPVLNRPVMAYAIELLKRQNIKEVEVCLYQNPGEIEAHFGDGRRWGMRLNFHLQREPLGDGGALRRVFPKPNETLLLLPADILIDLDIETAYEFHKTRGSALTVIAVAPISQLASNLLPTAPDGRIQQANHESPEPARLIPVGAFFIEPEIVEYISIHNASHILPDLLQTLLAAEVPVYAYHHMGYWNGLSSFESYFNAQFELLSIGGQPYHPEDAHAQLRFISRQGREIAPGVWCGLKTLVHSSVQTSEPTYIGENCRISKDVRIGPEVIIGQHVIVDEAATLSRALILDQTYIGRLVDIDQKIVSKNLVIDLKTGESIHITDRFLLDKNQPELVDSGFRQLVHSSLAALLLFAISPLLLALSVLILLDRMELFSSALCLHAKLNSGQARAPQYNQFALHRFSTSRPDGTQTALGKLLEQNEFHRLPELLNVVKGELSMVGVKPLPENEATNLHEEWQMTRFSVPAGFTGLWYVNQPETFEEILISDVYYAATRDWHADVQIFLQTPVVWLRKTQAKLRLSADSGGVS